MFYKLYVWLMLSWAAAFLGTFYIPPGWMEENALASFFVAVMIAIGAYATTRMIVYADGIRTGWGGPSESQTGTLWFFSDVVVTIGMLGTVTGLMLAMTNGFSVLAQEGDLHSNVEQVITAFGQGMGLALVTTAVGILVSMQIKFGLIILESE